MSDCALRTNKEKEGESVARPSVRPSVRPSNGSIDGAVRRDVEAAASPSSEGPSLSFPLFPNSFVSRRKRKYSSPQKKLAHVGKTAKSHVKSFSWLIGMVSSNNEGKKAKIDVLYILAKPCAPHQGLAGSLADVMTNQMPASSGGNNFQIYQMAKSELCHLD